jgi:hypothetical protein
LGPGAETTLNVTFAPTAEGDFACDLMIASNGGTATIPLSGRATPPAAIPLLPSPLAPAGLALMALLAGAMTWMWRRALQAS